MSDSKSKDEDKDMDESSEVKEKDISNAKKTPDKQVKTKEEVKKPSKGEDKKKTLRKKINKSKWKTTNYMEAHWKFNHQTGGLLEKTLNYYKLRPTGKLVLCNRCTRGKARRNRIQKEDLAKATKPGEQLKMDLSGLFHKTIAGSKYWMKVICQYSQKC